MPSDLSPVNPRNANTEHHNATKRNKARRWLASTIATLAAVAVGVLMFNLLGDAALFFYNVDEAVAKRDELGERRFKVQGTPLNTPSATFKDDLPALSFTIGFNNTEMQVLHVGDPPDLFQTGVPVVLEGSWQKGSWQTDTTPDASRAHTQAPDASRPQTGATQSMWYFASDRMLVKHDNDYRQRADYDERTGYNNSTTSPDNYNNSPSSNNNPTSPGSYTTNTSTTNRDEKSVSETYSS